MRVSAEARVQYLNLWDTVLRERVSLLRGEVEEEADTERPRAQRIERPREGEEGTEDGDAETPGGEGGAPGGPAVEALTWRYRMERQVSRYRRFLMNDERYRPLAEPRKPRNL